MSKSYIAKKNFWIGEINKELKTGEAVEYDDIKSILVIKGHSFDVKNLKAAIKADWLSPQNGKLPKLDGPVGETAEETADRKRKDRFTELAKKEKRHLIVKDEREVGKIKIGGCIEQTKSPEEFNEALQITPVVAPKTITKNKKFSTKVIEDDTKVVKSGNLFNKKEIKAMKKATNQEKVVKKDPKVFQVFDDHYNSDTIHVGKYVDLNREQTIRTWSQLHWTKKNDIIKKADKGFLNELKGVESSDKIKKRINKQIKIV